jgi:hypothetical protein
MSTSPGTIAIVANAKDYRDVTPPDVQVICDLTSLAVAIPPANRLLGIFTELESEWPIVLKRAASYQTRPMFIQDGGGKVPQSILGTMPSWGIPLIEAYQYAGETFPDAKARWRRDASNLMAWWPNALGVVLQSYRMNTLYPDAEVVKITAAGVELINAMGTRCMLALCFAWQRKDGADSGANAVITEAQRQVCAQTPGWPTLPPINPIPPPVVNPSIIALT